MGIKKKFKNMGEKPNIWVQIKTKRKLVQSKKKMVAN